MVEPLRHRQTKGAATDMFYLTPPRHISTLPKSDLTAPRRHFRSSARTGHHHVGQSPDLGVCSPSLAGELKPSKVAASSILQIGMAGEQ